MRHTPALIAVGALALLGLRAALGHAAAAPHAGPSWALMSFAVAAFVTRGR